MTTQTDTVRALEDLVYLAELVTAGRDCSEHLGRLAVRYRDTPVGGRLGALVGRRAAR